MTSISDYSINDVRDAAPIGFDGYLVTRDGNVWSSKSNKWKSVDYTGCTLMAIAPQHYIRQSVKLLVAKLFTIPELLQSGRFTLIENGKYLISPYGELYSCERGLFLKANIVKQYAYVPFNGRSVLLHRLVASVFIPNPNGYTEVNHKDGNKLNNCASNLEWCTRSMNMKHAYDNGYLDDSLRLAREARKLKRNVP